MHFFLHVEKRSLHGVVNVWGLTHWDRVTHICVTKIDQLWHITNWTLRTNFSEILIEIDKVSFKKIHLKMSGKSAILSGLGLNVFRVTTRRHGITTKQLISQCCNTISVIKQAPGFILLHFVAVIWSIIPPQQHKYQNYWTGFRQRGSWLTYDDARESQVTSQFL